MFRDKSNVRGSLKNMTWEYTVTQSAKKATGMLKLEKTGKKRKRKFRSGTSATIKWNLKWESPSKSTRKYTDFSHKTVKGLKDELNVKGFSNKNKAQLVKQLEEMCHEENMETHKK